MNSKRRRINCFVVAVFVFASLTNRVNAAAAEGPDDTTRPAVPDHRVVLRVSAGMLNSLINDKAIDREFNVADVILGTSISGTARVTGQPGVRLVASPDKATFLITLEGVATSRTTGYNGPAILYCRSVTRFTATKQVVFDPGQGFYGLPAKVTAQTQTFLEGVDSTRGGIVGRIVRNRAGQIAAQSHDEATEIARQKAARRIEIAFERGSAERLARLNWIADLRSKAVAVLSPAGNGEPKYSSCTTPDYVQMATSFGNTNSPVELPDSENASADNPHLDQQIAPVQLWIHDSLIVGQLAGGLDLLNTQRQANDLLLATLATAKLVGSNADPVDHLREAIGNLQMTSRKVGQWRLIEFATPDAVAKQPTPHPSTVGLQTATVNHHISNGNLRPKPAP